MQKSIAENLSTLLIPSSLLSLSKIIETTQTKISHMNCRAQSNLPGIVNSLTPSKKID
jgi:hypothetical protein